MLKENIFFFKFIEFKSVLAEIPLRMGVQSQTN